MAFPYHDLREYMEACYNAGEMVTIEREVDWNLEAGAIARRITEIGAGEAELLAVQIPEGAAIEGRTVQQLTQSTGFPETCVIAGIIDGERRVTIPRGAAQIAPRSELLVVARPEEVPDIVAFLTRRK